MATSIGPSLAPKPAGLTPVVAGSGAYSCVKRDCPQRFDAPDQVANHLWADHGISVTTPWVEANLKLVKREAAPTPDAGAALHWGLERERER